MFFFNNANDNLGTNDGRIETFGDTSAAMQANGDNNTLINNGQLLTGGAEAHGLFGNGTTNTLTNTGTITTTGSEAHGISSIGPNLGPVLNSGTVTASGTGGLGAFLGNTATFTNTDTGTITSQNATGVLANGGGTINNAGSITGADIGLNSGNGVATLTNSGTITGQNGAGVNFFGTFNNTLDNTGTINGNGALFDGVATAVQFSDGADTLNMNAGSINGAVQQGRGNDTLNLTAGSIGAVSQGDGNDTFLMTGGSVGGVIDLGAGDDTATLRDLTNANLSPTQRIVGGSGTDLLEFAGDGPALLDASQITGIERLNQIEGGLWTLGGSLTDFNLVNVQDGTLRLTGDNTAFAGATTVDAAGILEGSAVSMTPTVTNNGLVRFVQAVAGTYAGTISGSGALEKLEAGTLIMTGISSYSGTTTILNGALAVGDAASPAAALSGNGLVTVAPGATLAGYGSVGGSVINNGSIDVADAFAPFASGGQGNFTIGGTLTNASTVQLGGSGVGNTLTTTSYVGQSGTIALNTFLGGSGSPSDRLVIDGGTASGATQLAITNVGGPGAETDPDNGILVVDAINGATTSAAAFALSDRVAAGAYEYMLFRGGTTAGVDESWFLRSELIPVDPGQPVDAIPLYRAEVPIYAAAPAVARRLGITTLGTFHQRQGEQSLLTDQSGFSAAWGRIFGERSDLRGTGVISPEFDGTLKGLQTGVDLFARGWGNGHRDRVGVFYGHARADGDIRGFALGVERNNVGQLDLNANSIGAYWTHIGPSGWYIDAVAMQSWLDGAARSQDGTRGDLSGDSTTASLEGGYPMLFAAGLTLEPQGQLIWQRVSLDRTVDRFSSVDFDSDDSLVGRIGARLHASFQVGAIPVRPYLIVNLWENFSRADEIGFSDTDVIAAEFDGTSLEFGGGLVARMSPDVSVYATGGHTTALDQKGQTLQGNLGVRLAW